MRGEKEIFAEATDSTQQHQEQGIGVNNEEKLWSPDLVGHVPSNQSHSYDASFMLLNYLYASF